MPETLTARARWLALLVVCFAQFMVILDATIVNVALPSIQTDLHLSPENLQWIVNSYTLLFGGFLLLGGRAADLIGRRTVFMAGVVIFSAASLANALATTGTSSSSPAASRASAPRWSPPRRCRSSPRPSPRARSARRRWASGARSRAPAAPSACCSAASSPTCSAGSGSSSSTCRSASAPPSRRRASCPTRATSCTHRRFDVAGAVTVTAGLVLLVYAIVKAQEKGWGSLHTLGLSAVAVALLAGFVAIERRSPAPLVRLSILRVRTLATANVVLFIVAGGLFGMFFFASLYVQRILGYSPLQAGFAFLPVTIGIVVGAGASQQLIPRFGVKSTTLGGMTLAAIGLIVLAATTKVDGSYLGILFGLVPMSIGMGSTFVPLTLVATTGIEHEDAGLASGLFNTSQQVGGALGLAVLSTLAAGRTVLAADRPRPPARRGAARAALVDGFQLAFTVSAAMMVAGIVLVAVLMRRRDLARIDASQPVLVGA